jgi:Domain of unknown function (DUF4157)
MRQQVAQTGSKENVARTQMRQPQPAVQRPQPRGVTAELLNLQRTHGNRFVQRMLNGGVIQRKCACGGGCPRCQKASLLQTKLKINEPGDRYEQEADRIADRVMRMPEPTIQRQMELEEEEEEMLETKPVMRKATNGSDYTASPQFASQLNSTKGGGHTLPAPTLAFMNRAFGADFSPVRIHTGSKATEMNHAIQSNAFTHGADIYFNAGKYNTTTPEGNKLLAHELTHTIQQSDNGKGIAAKRQGSPDLEQRVSGTAEVIQRDMGLEFQAHNVISQKKGKTTFKRVDTKNKPLRKVGDLSMEVDTGSVMEFGTGHYKLWSDLKKDLDAVSVIIAEIQGLKKEALNPKKAVAPDNPLVFRGFKTNRGKVDITVEKENFFGRPQSNEDIVLSEFGSMLKENEGKTVFKKVEAKAQSVFGKSTTPDLTNFMQIIIYHLSLLQRTSSNFVIYSGEIVQPKAFLTLMNKTDYTAIFKSLSTTEQGEFQNLVNADPNPIATAAGVSMTDDLFKVGYWGWHPDRRNRVLIKQGKIVMIQKEISGVKGQGANQDIHKCGDKGVPKRYCKTKTPIEQVTVGAWLKSMITPSKRTKKSITAPLPTYRGSQTAGFSWGLSTAINPGMFLFEMRDYPGMPIADWPDFAEEKFNFAANCRPGSQLTYDGTKPKPKCPANFVGRLVDFFPMLHRIVIDLLHKS